ncbi:hypothetical protein KM043_016753 [Ampulex compressa]|nr:hypothetical protein KM043_016753 [Ampulex compressa]
MYPSVIAISRVSPRPAASREENTVGSHWDSPWGVRQPPDLEGLPRTRREEPQVELRGLVTPVYEAAYTRSKGPPRELTSICPFVLSLWLHRIMYLDLRLPARSSLPPAALD